MRGPNHKGRAMLKGNTVGGGKERELLWGFCAFCLCVLEPGAGVSENRLPPSLNCYHVISLGYPREILGVPAWGGRCPWILFSGRDLPLAVGLILRRVRIGLQVRKQQTLRAR